MIRPADVHAPCDCGRCRTVWCRCGRLAVSRMRAEYRTRGGTATRRSGPVCSRCGDRWAFEELANGARNVIAEVIEQ